MADPQQPFSGQGPQQPNFQPPKLKFEQLFDVVDIQMKMGLMFENTFKNMRKMAKTQTDGMWKDAQGSFNAYNKFTQTAERQKFEALKKMQKDAHKEALQHALDQAKEIRNSGKSQVEVNEALARTVRELKDKNHIIDKSQVKELADAQKAAQRSEVAASGTVMDKLKQKTADMAKSLFDTKDIWEAVVLLMIKASSRLSDVAKAQQALRGAGRAGTFGVGGTGAITGGVGGAESLFSKLQSELNLTNADVDHFVSTLARAPRALKEAEGDGGKALTDFVGAMGFVGVSAEDSMGLLVEASNSMNMSQKQLTETMKRSLAITKATGINFKDVMNTMLKMTEALRGVTFNGDEASKVLNATVFPLQQMGMAPEEIDKFAQAMSHFLGQMSPTNAAGLFALTQGRMPGSTGELEQGASMANTMQAFQGVLQNFHDPALRTIAAGKLGEQFGFQGAGTVKGAEAFQNVIDAFGSSSKEGEKAMEKFKKNFPSAGDLQAEGFKSMRDAAGTLQNVEKTLMRMMEQFSQFLFPAMQKTNEWLPKIGETVTRFNSLTGGNVDTNKGLHDLDAKRFVDKRMRAHQGPRHEAKEVGHTGVWR